MLRAWRGWNVKQAAEHCAIPEQSWHNWEAGKSPQKIHEKAKKIADRAPCDYVWLVSGMEGRQTRSETSRKAGRGALSLASSREKPDARFKETANIPILVST